MKRGIYTDFNDWHYMMSDQNVWQDRWWRRSSRAMRQSCHRQVVNTTITSPARLQVSETALCSSELRDDVVPFRGTFPRALESKVIDSVARW